MVMQRRKIAATRLAYHTRANFYALVNYLRRMTNRSRSMDEIATNASKTCLLIGLGNFGMEKSRHSVGRTVIDSFASQLDVVWKKERRLFGYTARISSKDAPQQLILLKPTLYMNENGRSVAKGAAFYGVEASDIFLIHDDIDLPLGKCAVKNGGSARGHNGVKSAVICMQSDRMPRLRFGIGRPHSRSLVRDYVLEDFDEEEMPLVEATVKSCVELLMIRFAAFIPRRKNDDVILLDGPKASDKPDS